VAYASKAKQIIHSLLSVSRQVFSHLQKSRGPSLVMIIQEDKHHHSEHPLPSFFSSQLYMLSMMLYGMEYAFGQLGSAVPAVSPSQLLVHPQSTCWWGDVRSRKAVTLCKHCSATKKSPCTINTEPQIQNIAPYKLLCRKSTPSHPKLVQIHRQQSLPDIWSPNEHCLQQQLPVPLV